MLEMGLHFQLIEMEVLSFSLSSSHIKISAVYGDKTSLFLTYIKLGVVSLSLTVSTNVSPLSFTCSLLRWEPSLSPSQSIEMGLLSYFLSHICRCMQFLALGMRSLTCQHADHAQQNLLDTLHGTPTFGGQFIAHGIIAGGM